MISKAGLTSNTAMVLRDELSKDLLGISGDDAWVEPWALQETLMMQNKCGCICVCIYIYMYVYIYIHIIYICGV